MCILPVDTELIQTPKIFTMSCVGAGQNLKSSSTIANTGSSIENLSTCLYCQCFLCCLVTCKLPSNQNCISRFQILWTKPYPSIATKTSTKLLCTENVPMGNGLPQRESGHISFPLHCHWQSLNKIPIVICSQVVWAFSRSHDICICLSWSFYVVSKLQCIVSY